MSVGNNFRFKPSEMGRAADHNSANQYAYKLWSLLAKSLKLIYKYSIQQKNGSNNEAGIIKPMITANAHTD